VYVVEIELALRTLRLFQTRPMPSSNNGPRDENALHTSIVSVVPQHSVVSAAVQCMELELIRSETRCLGHGSLSGYNTLVPRPDNDSGPILTPLQQCLYRNYAQHT
jgi:hypothetical protein